MNRELARLIASQVFLHACMAGMRLAAPLLALRQGYSAAAVGMLLALFALSQVFLALPAGRFADRHGLKRPVGLSVLACVTGAGLAVAFPVFPVLCVSALMTGGATGSAVIALQRHVGRAAASTTQLKKLFSLLAIGPAISNFIGPFSAGLLIDHAGTTAGDLTGYRAAFLLMACIPLLSWYWVRKVKELAPVVPPAGALRPKAWDLLADPMFRRLMLINWLMSSSWDVHTLVVPILGHERGLSASVIGTILGAFAIAATVIRLVMPLVADRLQEHVVLCAAFISTAVLFAVYPFMNTAGAMATCSVLLGLALGSVQPMIMSMLHQITPEHRHGEALGLRLMFINGSSVLMPILFGTVGTIVGVGGVFWIVGAVVVAGAKPAWNIRACKKP